MANPVATGAASSLPRSGARSRDLPGLPLRLHTWLRRRRLDADIRAGRAPGGPALALRESQLVEERRRRRLATRLEEIVDTPARPGRRGSSVPVDRRAVAIASAVLTDVILLLRSTEPVEARGMALGWRLLTDPGSPLYEAEDAGAAPGARLWRQSLAVLQALRPA